MNVADISEIMIISGCGMNYVSGLSVTKPSHQTALSSFQVYMSFRVKFLNMYWDLHVYRQVVSVLPYSVN